MRQAAFRSGRPFVALSLLLGVTAALVLPAPPGAFAAGVVTAVLLIAVTSTIRSASLLTVGLHVGAHARAVLERLVPRGAQSDPDARGHARPRAPGVLHPAV
jgi:uncharacterized protein DUF6412